MRKSSRKAYLAAAIAGAGLLLLLSGCGGGDDNSSNTPAASNGNSTATQTQSGGGSTQTSNGGGGSTDACSLLTPSEIEDQLGPTINAGKVNENEGQNSECEWDNPDDSVGVAVYVHVYTGQNNHDAENDFNVLLNAPSPLNVTTETVDGVGDKAFWVPGIDTLQVLKGHYSFTVQVVDIGSGHDQKTVAQALAGTVIGRLP